MSGTWPRLTSLPGSMGWLPFTTLVLSILGLADSAYQAYADYAGTSLLACSGHADACALVQNGPGAWILGIRVAVYGVAFYAFMVAICSPQAWRSKRPAIHRLRLAAVVAGILFVLYLIYTEVVRDGRICPYCTSVHVITFLLFSLIVFQAATASLRSDAEQDASVVVEDGPGVVRVDPRVADVLDRPDEDVPVLVGEVGAQQQPVRAERVDRAP